MPRLNISDRDLIIAAVITIIYLLTGFTPNPLEWPNQIENRFTLMESIQPENPDIIELNAKFEAFYQSEYQKLGTKDMREEQIEAEALEEFLYAEIPYINDFENYFAWEHFPEISEVITRGDDCDGMAIVACSILTRRGYESYVLNSKWHSWIEIYLDDGVVLSILTDPESMTTPWYLKYNANSINFRLISYLDVVFHNFILLLFLEQIFVTFYLLIKRYDSFQQIYTTLLALLLSPLPVLLMFASLLGY
ncbi:MAG: hypothetical protein EAX86_07565 [Candidatus Heimdallarchaeota archaeon]|nr:hypothetical protein [Candidatus Heimdallarchaeota archaeon]